MIFYKMMIVVSTIFAFVGMYQENDRLVEPMLILLLVSVAANDILEEIKSMKLKENAND